MGCLLSYTFFRVQATGDDKVILGVEKGQIALAKALLIRQPRGVLFQKQYSYTQSMNDAIFSQNKAGFCSANFCAKRRREARPTIRAEDRALSVGRKLYAS